VHHGPSVLATRLVYGLTGSVVCLGLALPAGALIGPSQDGSVPVISAAVFWLVGTAASVQLPARVLPRIERPMARVVVAPWLVGSAALTTGVVLLVPTAMFSAPELQNTTFVLYATLLSTALLASFGIPLQALLEWRHARRAVGTGQS